jgi:hypothetical protein
MSAELHAIAGMSRKTGVNLDQPLSRHYTRIALREAIASA